MRIGILGSGNVGRALAKAFLAVGGHDVLLATREPEGGKARQLRVDIPGATVCNFVAAAAGAELAVLCTPWATAGDALKLADAERNLKHKVLVDANNAIERGANGVRQVLGPDGSAGETVQSWLPRTQVVKCWNTTGAANFYRPHFSTTPTMFLCGDNMDAKQLVSKLVQTFGWEPFDAGEMAAARQLEAMAVLWINITMHTDDSHHAFKLL